MNLESGVAQLTARFEKQDAKIQKVSAQLATASPSGGGLETSKFAPAAQSRIPESHACSNYSHHFTISRHA